jgi:CRP/FNR family transcriptional regulator, cyclic AMP receptor protein
MHKQLWARSEREPSQARTYFFPPSVIFVTRLWFCCDNLRIFWNAQKRSVFRLLRTHIVGEYLRHSISGTCPRLPEELGSGLLANAKPCHLPAGDALFHARDKGAGLYRLDQGLLKVCLASSRGQDQILAILQPGEIVGDLAVIDGWARPASVVAMVDCELRFISRTFFQTFAQQHSEIHEELFKLAAARLREAYKTIASLAFLSMRARLAYALLELARNLGEGLPSGAIVIPIRLSQKDLAALAGVARENINRLLGEWERGKVVTKSPGFYRIEDQKKLEDEIDW